MLQFILSILAVIRSFFRSRSDTALEILALRQQLAVFKRKRPRPPLRSLDRLFWTLLRRCWSRWADVLIIVKPDTVVGWHRSGFRLYWRWRSRPGRGRPQITAEIRSLVRPLADENPDWGAPKIHGELLKLGLTVSERSVARYLRRIRRHPDPGQRWLAFLQNHREGIVAFDFFTVPTVIFQVLYCFSSSSMDDARSCTSTSRAIQPRSGSCSSCARHFPERARIVTRSSIAIQNSVPTSSRS